MPLALAAIGGNALFALGRRAAEREQQELDALASALASLVGDGWDLVVTHGNGPQVGDLLLQAEAEEAGPHTSLDVLDAETQGWLGYLLQRELGNAFIGAGLRRAAATLLTQVVVDAADPAFRAPSKPVGPFYDVERARWLVLERGWSMVEDAGRGYRRLVPSPRPVEIVDWRLAEALLAARAVVVAAGGGGIPVVRRTDGRLQGVEAVIDKDYTSALLGRLLGADVLLIVTAVGEVRLGFGHPWEQRVDRCTVAEARGWLAEGQFPPGSMGPKVEAAADFAESTGKPALITSAALLLEAMAGRAGTSLL
jgi:carbamate kinase